MTSASNKLGMYDTTLCGEVQPVLVSTPFTTISLIKDFRYILPRPPAFASCLARDDITGVLGAGVNGLVAYLTLETSR
ncbi:hypothetical protein Q4I30_007365 [Leishmania utingensis]|uniref:Uncharacterized protein n=1 Tax=Leishmania utingensis TaxID=653362 RepID=A0AAW2ZZ52_9TRYP